MLDKIWSNESLNGLVNNAAGNSISKNDNLSPRGFDAISNIVMNGTFYVTRPCGAHWIKVGVAAMTQSLALEWGNRGIRLHVIAPGPFPTKGAWDRLMPNENLARNYTGTVPMGRTGEHSELANLATFLLADQCAYINGAVIPIDGGQWLNGGGTFSWLSELSNEDWVAVSNQIKSSNEQDKTERS